MSSEGLRGFLALSGRGIKRHSLRKCVDGGLSYVLRLLCWIIFRGLVWMRHWFPYRYVGGDWVSVEEHLAALI